MKKIICILLAVVLTTGTLTACTASKGSAAINNGKLSIVTTIFPEYDWVRNILGENPSGAEVTMLLDSGVDLHSFQPTVEDILKISTCDLFIYVGGESDEWVDDVLKEATNKDMQVINLLEVLGDAVKEEELVEGMQGEDEEHDHEGGDHAGEDHEHDEEVEYDEHVWLSLKNASVLVEKISDTLCKIDPANADKYKKNAESYKGKLGSLDEKFQAVVSAAKYKTLLFGDRFPFRYLVDDYGLSYYAAFVGCSAETEASFETITFLANKLDELSLPAVCKIEGNDHRIAETIIGITANKDRKILTFDSMQSTTSNAVKEGATYLSAMEKNLTVLKEALGSDTADIPGASNNAVTPDDPLDTANIDVDLTILSSTMVYAEVYNMLVDAQKYVGKTVKMNGLFTTALDEETGERYFACIIQDATACCAQGIEFDLAGTFNYPEDYPALGDEICVVGVFDTYQEGNYVYCTLRNAKFI